jgi:beta-lactamase class A
MCGCTQSSSQTGSPAGYKLTFDSAMDPALQASVVAIDAKLRSQYGMASNQTAIGVLDLRTHRLALVNPDLLFYGASVPKIAILLAYFELRPEAATQLDPATRRELGEMIKISSNELAAKYSMLLGLSEIRRVIEKYQLYDRDHGGGIWVGKHYGVTGERVGDPIGDHSHAVTARQVLRYLLLLQQGKLVSPQASKTMLEIFASPDISHHDIKFFKGLNGRGLTILRKSGSWENWLHDAALVEGPDRNYAIVGLTENPKGDDYLADLAGEIDRALTGH